MMINGAQMRVLLATENACGMAEDESETVTLLLDETSLSAVVTDCTFGSQTGRRSQN